MYIQEESEKISYYPVEVYKQLFFSLKEVPVFIATIHQHPKAIATNN